MKHITKWIVLALALFAGQSVKSQGIEMLGNVSCEFIDDKLLNIKVDKILNSRQIGTISGPLSIDVWLTKHEYTGQTIFDESTSATLKGDARRFGACRLAYGILPQLMGGYHFQNIRQHCKNGDETTAEICLNLVALFHRILQFLKISWHWLQLKTPINGNSMKIFWISTRVPEIDEIPGNMLCFIALSLQRYIMLDISKNKFVVKD